MRKYQIAEIFDSLQGEGLHSGRPASFVRFAGCNLNCRKATMGFDCDTDFDCTEELTAEEISQQLTYDYVILTGGEPALQVNRELTRAIRSRLPGCEIGIETNGTLPLRVSADWISVSPKSGAPVVLDWVDEVRCVLAVGQYPPELKVVDADFWYVSPAADDKGINCEALQWCIKYVLEHPGWRLSVQQHKEWRVR